MEFQYNRKLASVVLIVCILVSVVGLGGAGLARERSEALRVFNEGIDTSFAVRFSMDAYLENCTGYARLMAEEIRLHVDADDANAAKALELSGQIGDGDDLSLRYEGYEELNGLVEAMYTDFHAAVSDEADQEVFDHAYANYQGEVQKIGYDEYNPMAREYNKLSQSGIAGLVAGLFRLGQLETFG